MKIRHIDGKDYYTFAAVEKGLGHALAWEAMHQNLFDWPDFLQDRGLYVLCSDYHAVADNKMIIKYLNEMIVTKKSRFMAQAMLDRGFRQRQSELRTRLLQRIPMENGDQRMRVMFGTPKDLTPDEPAQTAPEDQSED
jgi:hypothetical protein